MTNYTILKVKDICNLLEVSESTAKRYLKDIKVHYSIKHVLKNHFDKYFKV